MTIDDVQHYSEEEKNTIIASYPPHELEARTKGIPTLGSGRIFPVPEHALAIEQQEFPAHWPKIGGMDFGWDHPFAAVELVWDRDADIVYVAKTHRFEGSNANYTRCGPAQLGQGVAVGMAARRPPRDVGGGRGCPGAAI